MALNLPPGSKVLTTPFSFIATANCILSADCEPVFCDVDPSTFMLTAEGVREALQRDPAIRAVLPVHLYGQACEIHEIVELAHKRGVYVIEDCAQAHGAGEFGDPVGAIGDLGVFSFYPSKNMMTGEGGMITGRNAKLLDRCRLIINHGSPVRYRHTQLGFNFRMTSIAAALGLCQLTRLPAWNARRRANAAALNAGLADLPWLTIPFERLGCTHVYHQYVVKAHDRDRLRAYLSDAGIGTDVYYPVHHSRPAALPEPRLSQRPPPGGPPSHRASTGPARAPGVSEEDLHTIIAALRAFVPTEDTVSLVAN